MIVDSEALWSTIPEAEQDKIINLPPEREHWWYFINHKFLGQPIDTESTFYQTVLRSARDTLLISRETYIALGGR